MHRHRTDASRNPAFRQFIGHPPPALMAHIVRKLPEGLRGLGREHADRMLANTLLDPNAVGSAEMARLLSAPEAPQTVLRATIPANATNAALE